MTDNRDWFVKSVDGKVYGPAKISKLVEWAKDGRIEPTGFVSTDRVDWLEACSIDELEMNCSPADNDERSMFFVRAVIESIRKMRWVPDIIQCTGWISALAPVYIRTLYGDDPSFRDAKIVSALFNEQIAAPLDARLSEKMHMDGIPKNALKPIAGKELTCDDLLAYTLKYSDAVIQCEDGVSDQVLEAVKDKPMLSFIDDDDVNKVTEFYASL